MYIVDDVCYAGELEVGIKVKEVKPLENLIMLVTFSTGEKRLLDATELQAPIFNVVRDKKIWSKAEVVHGFISWDNGKIDIAPETVYSKSYAYK